jgi:hypothetical protein
MSVFVYVIQPEAALQNEITMPRCFALPYDDVLSLKGNRFHFVDEVIYFRCCNFRINRFDVPV